MDFSVAFLFHGLNWVQYRLAFDLHNNYCVVEVVHVVQVVPIGSFQQEKQKQNNKKIPLARCFFGVVFVCRGFFFTFFLEKKYENIGGPKSIHTIQASRPKIITSIYATNLCDHLVKLSLGSPFLLLMILYAIRDGQQRE